MKIGKYAKVFGVGPLGALISGAMLGLLWLLDNAFHHLRILSDPRPLRIVGLTFIVSWLCWHAWGIKTISQWWRHDQLCTSGPYRFVRHPIYAGGSLLGATGISLMFNSWIILLLPVLTCIVYSVLVRKEEAMMLAVFGDQYRRYTENTGGLFPKLASFSRRTP